MSKPPKDKPKVNLTPPAAAIDASGERTIEFSHAYGRGLISFRAMPDGTLRVEVHDQDPTVQVNVAMGRGPTVTGTGGRK